MRGTNAHKSFATRNIDTFHPQNYMTIDNPNQLVEEFKKSGEFERIRRELLNQFQNSEGLSAFKNRVEDVARQRLSRDSNLLYMPQEFIYRELMQEIDRYPIVERAIAELPLMNETVLSTRIHSSIEKCLADRGIKLSSSAQEPDASQEPSTRPSEEAGENSKHCEEIALEKTSSTSPAGSPQKRSDPEAMELSDD